MRGLRRHRLLPAALTAYAAALAAVAVATGVSWILAPVSELSNLVMVYLLGIVAVAMRTGRGPSLLAAVLSMAAVDYFFVPPRFTLAVSDTRYLFTFAVMLLVSLVISGLTVRSRLQAEAARHRERQTAALYEMTRELASSSGLDALPAVAIRHLSAVFHGQVVMLVAGAADTLEPAGGTPLDLGDDELEAARRVFEHRQPAGPGAAARPSASALWVPLLGSAGPVGVLGLRMPDRRLLGDPERLRQLEAFAAQTALALERARLAREAQEAEVRIESERLRNSLLSSVSHDLRTPLATITGAVSTILDAHAPLEAGTQRELLESVHEEAERLNRLVQNLLEMTRLESGALQLRKELHPPEEVIGAALGRLGKRLAGRRVTTKVPPDLPLVPMDDVLMEQVLVNLLDNTLKYTPAGSPIEVIATATDETLTVEIADHGPGLQHGEQDRVFDKFYRGEPVGARGAGLGLAICRGIVRAHGGRIWAQNLPGGGVAFLFTLPRGAPESAPVPSDA